MTAQLTDASDLKLMKIVAVFIPELKPLIPDVVAAIETLEKAEAIAAPHFASGGSDSVFSLLPLIGELGPMMPDLIKAVDTVEKVDVIVGAYYAKIAAAEAAKPST